MRKLLSTTALLGALALSQAAVAQPITVTLGGGLQFNAGIVSEDQDTDLRGHGFETDTEIFIGAEGQSGNLTYGAKIELQGDQQDTDDSDEVYGYAYGDWGRVEVGDQDGAADRMTYGAPSDFGTGGIDGDYTNFINQSFYVNGRTSLFGLDDAFKSFDSDDATKITYFTPRFSGFQFGASYAPDGAQTALPARGETGAIGTTLNGAAVEVLDANDFENYIELGLNYVNTFDSVDFALSAAYVTADAKDFVGVNYEDLSSYTLGLSLGYMGFTFGGGYTTNQDSGYLSTAANDDDFDAFNVGLQYATGPFTIGVNALFAENEGYTSSATDNTLDVYSFGTTYQVAPGLATYLEATMFEAEIDTGAAAATENDGSVVIIGTAIEF